MQRTHHYRLLGVSLLASTFVLVGCSSQSGKAPQATVSGKVTVKGAAPSPGGTVTFTSVDQKQGSSAIDGDGSYSIKDAPLGPVQITVKAGPQAPPPPPGAATMAGMKPSGRAIIPRKYTQPNNGLAYTVSKGDQTHNIELGP